jgi:hypothetical protein
VGNRLTHGHFYFTKPHYNAGLILSASFSRELEGKSAPARRRSAERGVNCDLPFPW